MVHSPWVKNELTMDYGLSTMNKKTQSLQLIANG